jgi:hypothetical protein
MLYQWRRICADADGLLSPDPANELGSSSVNIQNLRQRRRHYRTNFRAAAPSSSSSSADSRDCSTWWRSALKLAASGGAGSLNPK